MGRKKKKWFSRREKPVRVKEGVRVFADEKCDFFCDGDKKRKQRRIMSGG